MTQHRTLTELSLTQAAKATGRSKSTINRAIKSGKMSATRHVDGSYSIEGSELSRVFRVGTPSGSQWVALEPQSEPTMTTILEAENAALRAALERERQVLNDLRADRDAWRQQATNLLGRPRKRLAWWPFT
jgi:hypothetical protein